MHPKMAHIAGLYQVTGRLFNKALSEIKPPDIAVRPQDRANSFLFVAGHITAHRFKVAAMLGLEDKWAPEKLFDMGAEVKEPSVYPSLDEIKDAFNRITEKIYARFDEASESDWSTAPPFEIAPLENSVGGIVAFLHLHEAYHIGQLAYILRLHGGERLVG